MRHVLEGSSIAGKPHVLARLPEIYTRFMLAVDSLSSLILSRNASTRLRKKSGAQRFSRHSMRAEPGSTM